MCTKRTPAFRFGYGLSYTDFAYRNLKVTGGATLTVSVDVTNTGTRAGADGPQLYVGHGDTPMRLAGFRRVTLGPGETRRVVFVAEPRVVADYDIALPGWRIAGGAYCVAVGHDAADRALSATEPRSEEHTSELQSIMRNWSAFFCLKHKNT